MFWVVDNFLMKKGKTKAKLEEKESGQDSRNGSKIRYRRAASHEESESEASSNFYLFIYVLLFSVHFEHQGSHGK